MKESDVWRYTTTPLSNVNGSEFKEDKINHSLFCTHLLQIYSVFQNAYSIKKYHNTIISVLIFSYTTKNHKPFCLQLKNLCKPAVYKLILTSLHMFGQYNHSLFIIIIILQNGHTTKEQTEKWCGLCYLADIMQILWLQHQHQPNIGS